MTLHLTEEQARRLTRGTRASKAHRRFTPTELHVTVEDLKSICTVEQDTPEFTLFRCTNLKEVPHAAVR